MHVEALIDELKKHDKDAIVTITNYQGGWSNIGEVKVDGSSVTITTDDSRPFSSDK